MLEDVLRPGSDVAAILVHHTSRFTRDATEARIAKSRLRKVGVRVVSVCQDLADDPFGELMEEFFECIDQYESRINGVRTSAAMAACARPGFYPCGRPPYGFRTQLVELRPNVDARRLLLHLDLDANGVPRRMKDVFAVASVRPRARSALSPR